MAQLEKERLDHEIRTHIECLQKLRQDIGAREAFRNRQVCAKLRLYDIKRLGTLPFHQGKAWQRTKTGSNSFLFPQMRYKQQVRELELQKSARQTGRNRRGPSAHNQSAVSRATAASNAAAKKINERADQYMTKPSGEGMFYLQSFAYPI